MNKILLALLALTFAGCEYQHTGPWDWSEEHKCGIYEETIDVFYFWTHENPLPFDCTKTIVRFTDDLGDGVDGIAMRRPNGETEVHLPTYCEDDARRCRQLARHEWAHLMGADSDGADCIQNVRGLPCRIRK
jgi:hypothetical protein